MKRIDFRITGDTYAILAARAAVLILFLQLGRWWFYRYNLDLLGEISARELSAIFLGGLRFDLAAAVLLLLPYFVLRILPFDFVYGTRYTRLCDWLYGLCGSIGLVANLCDTPFYRFTGMRTQALHLQEVLQDSATADVMGAHLRTYFGLALGGVCFIALFLFVASRFRAVRPARRRTGWRYAELTAALAAAFFGLRGSFDFKEHPLQLTDAHAYCSENRRTALVLNTPFSVLRTIGKDFRLKPYAFFTAGELAARRSDLHRSQRPGFERRNIVQIILEGCGNSFIGALNPYAAERPIADRPLTPFLDSLAAQSLLFTDCYTHLRKSSAGITALLGGFPAYSPFLYMLSPYRDNEVETLASLLGGEGYRSTFFCGCNKGSYAFRGMAEVFGYDRFYDRTDYEADYGAIDYDGQWGIFDHAMAAHLLRELNAMPEPFLVSWFTLNTHNPFTLPEAYRPLVRSEPGTMAGAVEYIDRVLREFFTAAAREPWFARTLFVITADHGHGTPVEQAFYDNPAQLNRIPLLLYTPDGSIAPRRDDRTCGQIDVSPTVLDALGYPREYFALGNSLLQPFGGGILFDDQTDYRYVEQGWMLRIDKERIEPIALYDYRADPALQHDRSAEEPERVAALLASARAFLQDWTQRLVDNRMKHDE